MGVRGKRVGLVGTTFAVAASYILSGCSGPSNPDPIIPPPSKPLRTQSSNIGGTELSKIIEREEAKARIEDARKTPVTPPAAETPKTSPAATPTTTPPTTTTPATPTAKTPAKKPPAKPAEPPKPIFLEGYLSGGGRNSTKLLEGRFHGNWRSFDADVFARFKKYQLRDTSKVELQQVAAEVGLDVYLTKLDVATELSMRETEFPTSIDVTDDPLFRITTTTRSKEEIDRTFAGVRVRPPIGDYEFDIQAVIDTEELKNSGTVLIDVVNKLDPSGNYTDTVAFSSKVETDRMAALLGFGGKVKLGKDTYYYKLYGGADITDITGPAINRSVKRYPIALHAAGEHDNARWGVTAGDIFIEDGQRSGWEEKFGQISAAVNLKKVIVVGGIGGTEGDTGVGGGGVLLSFDNLTDKHLKAAYAAFAVRNEMLLRLQPYRSRVHQDIETDHLDDELDFIYGDNPAFGLYLAARGGERDDRDVMDAVGRFYVPAGDVVLSPQVRFSKEGSREGERETLQLRLRVLFEKGFVEMSYEDVDEGINLINHKYQLWRIGGGVKF